MGFCTSISAGNLRATLVEFSKHFPQIEFATIERSRLRLMCALCSGMVDVVIHPGRLFSACSKSLLLWSERVIISMPQKHALAAREAVYWTDKRFLNLLRERYPAPPFAE
ncbi:LysR substrate-binding domain-containing protein [Bradyrhizobium sp. Arg816]|uniref:LysR substrate-binding domain-containing protein n=1 Tax=Bradyrhizobium sp. Arg816 TaxID=2998491 RepID=UPI0034D56D5C